MISPALIEFIGRQLEGVLGEPGGIVYSAADTLRQGSVYVMGLNPGGDPATDKWTIRQSLEELPTRKGNDYLDPWGKHAKGEAPLQRHIAFVLGALGVNLEDTFATNLIFRKTRSADGLSIREGDLYWPVHQHFMAIVQPRLVLTFGNSKVSPYAYMLGRCQLESALLEDETSEPAEHGTWRLKSFRARIDQRVTRIVGLPHLSRYNPTGKLAVKKWLCDTMAANELQSAELNI